LILNAFEYYSSSIIIIVNRAFKGAYYGDIDHIVSQIAIEYKVYMKYLLDLQKNKALSVEGVIKIAGA